MNAPQTGVLAVLRDNALRAALDRQYDDDAEKLAAASDLAIAAVIELIVCVDDMFAERAARGAKDVGTLVALRVARAAMSGGAA